MTNQIAVDKLLEMQLSAMSDAFLMQRNDPQMQEVPFEDRITELGTDIVALTLHDCVDCATIVADSAIELYEICLPHTYILCSFALFSTPFFKP